MDSIIPSEKHLFSKIKVARELLRQRAEELVNEYLDIAKQAKIAGDYETAAKSLQWLLDHIPGDSDGVRVVDSSVDKTQPTAPANTQPSIQIGIQVGGVNKKKLTTTETKKLPGNVIEGETSED